MQGAGRVQGLGSTFGLEKTILSWSATLACAGAGAWGGGGGGAGAVPVTPRVVSLMHCAAPYSLAAVLCSLVLYCTVPQGDPNWGQLWDNPMVPSAEIAFGEESTVEVEGKVSRSTRQTGTSHLLRGWQPDSRHEPCLQIRLPSWLTEDEDTRDESCHVEFYQ